MTIRPTVNGRALEAWFDTYADDSGQIEDSGIVKLCEDLSVDFEVHILFIFFVTSITRTIRISSC